MPGIPGEFLTSFFRTSDNVEALISENWTINGFNIEVVNRLLENATYDMKSTGKVAYLIVRKCRLRRTRLLQYSNRYRSFDENVSKNF